MSTAVLEIKGLELLSEYFDDISDLDWRPVLDDIGGRIISQTKLRIVEDKRSPSGDPWVPHSKAYKKTRHKNQSLLISSGDLLTSFVHDVMGDSVVVGSNLKKAATHQYGRDFYSYANPGNADYPARPYLGLSDENGQEVIELVSDYITDILNGEP